MTTSVQASCVNTDKLRTSIGDLFRKCRQLNGLTQQDAADILGRKRQTIAAIEAPSRGPSFSAEELIALGRLWPDFRDGISELIEGREPVFRIRRGNVTSN